MCPRLNNIGEAQREVGQCHDDVAAHTAAGRVLQSGHQQLHVVFAEGGRYQHEPVHNKIYYYKIKYKQSRFC